MDQHDRAFVDLAVAKGFISFENVRRCFEDAKNGRVSIREMLLGLGWVTQEQSEEIAGDLRARETAANGPMDDNRFCEEVVKRRLLSADMLYDAVRMSDKYRLRGKALKSLDEILVELGFLTVPQIQAVRGGTASAGMIMSEGTHGKVGDIAVRKGYIDRKQIEECLTLQEREMKALGRARMLGEILLAKGYIDNAQLQDILTNPVHEAKPLSIPGYELQSRIGQGAMGEIYKARQLSVDRQVAIKLLPLRHGLDSGSLDAIVREAKLLAKLDHPNIVKAIDSGRVGNRYYFVMDYVDGTPVQKLLEMRTRLPERECLKIGLHIAQALDHAGRHGILHRDIKPGNIMIARDGTVKLFDLGVARMLEGGDAKDSGAVGTPFYMAPEAITQSGVDVRADLYSLGATLYHCATGEPPFKGPSIEATLALHLHRAPVPPKEVNPDLSPEFSSVILRTLSKSAEERPQSPAELARVLEDVLKGQVEAALQTRVRTERRTSRLVETPQRLATPLRPRFNRVVLAVMITLLVVTWLFTAALTFGLLQVGDEFVK